MPLCNKCKKWIYSFENHYCKLYLYSIKEYFGDEWQEGYAVSAEDLAGQIAREYMSKGDNSEFEILVKDEKGVISKFVTECYTDIDVRGID